MRCKIFNNGIAHTNTLCKFLSFLCTIFLCSAINTNNKNISSFSNRYSTFFDLEVNKIIWYFFLPTTIVGVLLADFLKNSSNFLTSSGLISNPPVRAHTAPSNPTMAASVKTLYHVAMVSVVDQRVFYLIISTNFTYYY